MSREGSVDFPPSVCETRGHYGSWLAGGSACGLLFGGLHTGMPWMLMPMPDLSLPPTSYLFLLSLPYSAVCVEWSAVAAFGTGFAVGNAAIAVLCSPCSCVRGGRGVEKALSQLGEASNMLYL